MTPEEIQDHLDLQQATIQDQKEAIDKKDADLLSLQQQVKEFQEKLSANAQAAKPADKPEDNAPAVDSEAAKKLAELEEKNAALQAKLDQDTLEKEFPRIKDWSVVVGSNLEQKRAHAAKIVSLINVEPAKPSTDPAADKGNKFAGVPPAGAPSTEALSQEEFNKRKSEMLELQKKGDVGGVLEKCFELQPNATKALFQG